MSATPPVIIIGAGLAGWTIAREFRKLDTRTPVLLITADGGDFYAKPSLSNAFAQQRGPAQLVTTPAQQMAQNLGVTLLPHTHVTAIDPAARTISCTGGSFGYRQLVLATGAQPIRVSLAGDAADQVLSINSLADFAVFHTRLLGLKRVVNPRPHVMIMGAGLIGCEFANDLASAGYQVSVADPANGPIAALLPAAASAQLAGALTALGVNWHFGASIKSVQHRADNGDNTGVPALQVELSNGALAQVDIVLSAIGLRADTALAQSAGLVTERGLLVDAHLQTSAPHIYALGDIAQYAPGIWGSPETLPLIGGRTMPYVMPIMNAARALAATLAEKATKVVFPLMPVAIKTPALPVVVAAPAPGTSGAWQAVEAGVWHFKGSTGQNMGFVLTGQHTSRKAEQIRLMAIS